MWGAGLWVILSLIFVPFVRLGAQEQLGVRDYFKSVGMAELSNNTLSHYSLAKPAAFFLDREKMLAVEVPSDAIVTRNLIGVNKYRAEEMTWIYDNLFIFSVQQKSGWKHYIPLTYTELDADKNPLVRQHIALAWATEDFDLTLPAEADVKLIKVDMLSGRKVTTTEHLKVGFTTKSLSFGETVMSSVSMFSDKVLAKQAKKTKEMLEKFLKEPRKGSEKIFEGHIL